MKSLNYLEIGKRIKFKRHQFKLTQEKLAEKIDVSPTYISEIERGTSICSLAVITNIANVLELDLDFLIYGVTPSNVDTTFSEILKSIPEKNHTLYLELCKNIANTLK